MASPVSVAPEGTSILDTIRQSCKALLQEGSAELAAVPSAAHYASPHISISEEKIEEFVQKQLAALSESQLPKPINLPLLFSSVASEVNLLVTLHLLNIASGWRVELHAKKGQGAWDTICHGIIAMHIMGNELTADFMSRFDRTAVETYFGLEATVEVPVMPAVYEYKPGPLCPLVDMIVKVMIEAGNALRNRGHASWYDMLMAHAAPEGRRPTAAAFVRLLVEAIPGFRDVSRVGALDVYICKKAQLAAAYLSHKFAATLPAVFDFSDLAQLTVMADNVLPAVLRALGILVPSESVAAMIDGGVPIPRGEVEAHLRAASVVAGELIVKRCHAVYVGEPDKYPAFFSTFNEAALDEFLWTHGKHPDMRKLPRHATKDTPFY